MEGSAMDEILGAAFRALVQAGGGSELVPLVVFCIVLVLLGLGLGVAAMRLIRRDPTTAEGETAPNS
jgi:hypothetical protein